MLEAPTAQHALNTDAELMRERWGAVYHTKCHRCRYCGKKWHTRGPITLQSTRKVVVHNKA